MSPCTHSPSPSLPFARPNLSSRREFLMHFCSCSLRTNLDSDTASHLAPIHPTMICAYLWCILAAYRKMCTHFDQGSILNLFPIPFQRKIRVGPGKGGDCICNAHMAVMPTANVTGHRACERIAYILAQFAPGEACNLRATTSAGVCESKPQNNPCLRINTTD